MPVIRFKGRTAIESYHHTIFHQTLEFDLKLSVPSKRDPSLDGKFDGNMNAIDSQIL